MKNLTKTTLREVKSTFGRFMAILAIIALGVGFFSGVRITTPAMINMMDNFINDSNLYDYRLISTIGWDKDAPEAFKGQPDVKIAEGGYSLDVIYERADDTLVLKTHNIPDNVNGLLVQEGRLPEKADECVVIDNARFSVGDVLKVSGENKDDTFDSFAERTFTVVGKADSSCYIDYDVGHTSIGKGTFNGFIYVPAEALDMDYYTDIYIRFDNDCQIYSDEYKSFIDSKSDTWEELAQVQADKRYDRIVADANSELDDARKELDDEREKAQKELDDAKKELDDAEQELKDAEKELDDAEKEIAEGEKKLADAKKELDDGRQQLADAEQTLADSKQQLDEAEKKLIDGEAQLAEGQIQIDAARAELDAGQAEYEAQEAAFYAQYGEYIPMLDYLPPEQQEMLRGGIAQLEAAKSRIDSGRAELEQQQAVLNEKRAELESGRAEFESGRAEYEKGLAEYEKSKKDLEDGEKEYTDGLKELEDAKKKLADGKTEYEDGRKKYTDGLGEYKDGLSEFDGKISDAEAEISDAEKELAEIESPDVYVLGRDMNIGYATFKSDAEIVEQVARVFPIFFMLVAALVCMTTMSRMVEEQRTQIGLLKALGYSEPAIMGKFMFYSGSAALTGCVLGFFAGTYSFPLIIWVTYKLMYVPLDIPYLFDVKLFALSVGASLLCSLGMTWISCRVELAETAAGLMRPKAPKAGKRILPERIPFIWNRLKFLHKVSLRNIFRYKGRFFMMILGIGGCTALLLTGFGLRDSVARFADVQYDEIQICDATVEYNKDEREQAVKAISEKASDYLIYREFAWDLICDDGAKSVSLEVVDSFDNISEFMNFRTVTGEGIEYPKKNEAIICHSISDRFGVQVGDEITLRNSDMEEMKLTVTGVFENHVYNYIYTGKESYEEQFGEPVKFNYAYMNFTDDDKDSAVEELLENSSIVYVSLLQRFKENMAETMSSLDYVVILVIVCAAGLAFIVIYNLTNINITERTREIATIKVLGFFRNETSAYVLRENLALTSIGTVVGLGLGILLHRFVMAQIIIDVIEFSVRILPMSYIFSIILTFAFNFLVNIFMEIKLERINMAESLKSVD